MKRELDLLEDIKYLLTKMEVNQREYMEAKLHLELCETTKEKLIYIKSAMEKIDDV